MRATDDGPVRHDLLPGDRHAEGHGDRESACRGSSTLAADHIDDRDDTGFTADGELVDGMLLHPSMVLHRTDVD